MNDVIQTCQPCNCPPNEGRHRSKESSKHLTSAAEKKTRTRRLFLHYRTTGDPRLKETIFEEWKELARHWAIRYMSAAASYADLYQEGCIGLLVAIERFDLGKNVQFATFATHYIRGTIRDYCRKRTWCCYVPRNCKDAACKAMRLAEKTGREPTLREVEQLLGLSDDKAEAVLAATKARWPAMSLDNPLQTAMHIRLGADQRESPLSNLDSLWVDRAIWRMDIDDLLNKTLSSSDESIVRMYYYEGLSRREIASKTGTYEVAVSRSLHKSLARLRREIEGSESGCAAS